MNIKTSSFLFIVISLITSCTPKKQSTKIPKEAFPIVYRGHLYIKGIADGHKGNFVFDTGASNFYYDSTYYSTHDYNYSDFFNANLPGAGTNPQKVIVIKDTVSFKFGNNLYRTNIVPVLKLKPILGDFADGILGMEYFYESMLEINYENEYMRIIRSKDSIDLSAYSKIALTKKKNRLYIPLKVNINDTLTVNGEYMLDFGSGGSISLTSTTANKFKLNDNIRTKIPYFTKYGGVGGNSSSFDFNATSLQIGEYVFNNVKMSYSTDSCGAMSSNKHCGLLGNEIYERFNLIIDFINNDLYLRPNNSFNNPFEFSRLGFSYVDRNQTLKSWIVTGLFSSSNAHKSGLKIDDKILSVNGINVEQINYERQESFFKKLNNVKLKIKRNDEILEISFKLETLNNLS